MQGTYPAQLERQLNERRADLRYEVLNAGVPGFTSFQGRQYLEAEGFALEPDAIVVAFGYNDQCSARPGPKRAFSKDRPLSDREYAAALRHRNRLGIVRLAARLAANAHATPVDDSAASEDQPPQIMVKQRVSPAEYRENLRAIAEQCVNAKIKPVILVWPIVGQAIPGNPRGQRSWILYYQQAARDVAREYDAALVDLVPLVENRADLYIDVVHMNAKGYRAVAAAVADALLEHLPAPGPE